ncbi:MAG: 2,3,4,5-tetrahydropyridine-2,6-dicarboxylate N-succinyltransferase [Rickettsiaceae bacterium]
MNQIWEELAKIKSSDTIITQKQRDVVLKIIDGLNAGTIRVAEKINGKWIANPLVKQAILLYFKMTKSSIYKENHSTFYDKIPQKFSAYSEDDFIGNNCRVVPGAYVRNGAFIGKNTVIMPSFINIGAYIDSGCMIDTWATIGSCAQIGKNCHISGGTGIGGVLEPLQANPVIVENDCFIGARSEIAEGVIVEQGSVISMGVFLCASTKIIYRDTNEVIYGRIPKYSVVVPGSVSRKDNQPSLYCAVIIKTVDEQTRSKVSINELLRS